MPKIPIQDSLFDPPACGAIKLVDALAQSPAQSKQHTTFQRLAQQIEALRAQIQEWQAYQLHYNQRLEQKLVPLQTQLRTQRVAIAHLLDDQFHSQDVSRNKKLSAKVRSFILELVTDLLEQAHDDALVALHDRYSDVSHAECAAMDQAVSRGLVEQVFGVDLGDTPEGRDAQSIEEMIYAARLKRAQAAEQAAARRRSGKKTARQAQAQAQQAAAQQEVSQTVREVYRKLASALHPDRSSHNLSQERKTELMQRVNRAYEAGHLLDLLNIQLEIEQIDAQHLAELSAQRLTHYIQVLREQQSELKAELDALQAPYRSLVPYHPQLKPAHIDAAMNAEAARLKLHQQALEADLRDFADSKRLAAALKHYRATTP